MTVTEHVKDIKALEKKPRKEEALKLLRKISSYVKPIMHKHKWTVGLLREFSPTNPQLLGLNKNRGQEICIRLRPHGDDSRFFEFDDLIGTMLHELAHIVRGPHDAQFYKLLGELNKEYDALIDSGYRGEGFESPGHRVGQGISHNLPPHLARQKALQAAERRQRLGQVMLPTGGRKLGGASDVKALEAILAPGQLAAQAAERRMKDRLWCGSIEDGDVAVVGVKRPRTNDVHSSETPSDAVDRESEHGPARNTITPNSGNKGHRTHYDCAPYQDRIHEPIVIPDDDIPRNDHDDVNWTCPTCTLINIATKLQCEACCTIQPVRPTESSQSRTSLDMQWQCPKCTLLNDAMWRSCRLCVYVR
ncbi:hypothetical protein HDU85_004061 [Gaertneriomyces sp. JEL0708]|nr:hypothetical protein HDU85_004061 [Gaertneriomyces sp. JEL0708]